MNKGLKIGLIIGGSVLVVGGTVTLIVMSKASKRIIREAKKYVGIVELYNDRGWPDNPQFQKLMEKAGWVYGAMYCATFCRMVITKIAKGGALDYFKKNLSINSVLTYTNLANAGNNQYTEVIPRPEPGCLVCYEAHTELCESVNGDKMMVITANSGLGNGKYGVARKERTISKPFERVLGYVRIKKLN